jgi:hypothetical protein
VGFLKFFFENWKDRHPMLLQILIFSEHSRSLEQNYHYQHRQLEDLVQMYQSKGIIKKYDTYGYEDFEWIQLKNKILFNDHS